MPESKNTQSPVSGKESFQSLKILYPIKGVVDKSTEWIEW